uniref:Uncharacterized protein n=1 Tax=Anguilla anguilla TaxID=7936 RepID=A0A0E9T4Z3_ANGAN
MITFFLILIQSNDRMRGYVKRGGYFCFVELSFRLLWFKIHTRVALWFRGFSADKSNYLFSFAPE